MWMKWRHEFLNLRAYGDHDPEIDKREHLRHLQRKEDQQYTNIESIAQKYWTTLWTLQQYREM